MWWKDTEMERSLRNSTAYQRQDSVKKRQVQLEVKLWNAAAKGRLDEVLEMLEENEFGGMQLGSTMLDCIRYGDMKEKHGNAGLLRAVKMFHFHGANMSCVDELGQDTLSNASRTAGNDTELLRFVIDHTNGGIAHQDITRTHEPRMFEARTVEVAKLFMEHGAGVFERGRVERGSETLIQNHTHGYSGYPPGEKIRLIQFLIQLGCEINGRCTHGETALHESVQFQGEHAIISLLIEHGADVNAVNNFGRTPLYHAIGSKNLRFVQILCENGADISNRDIDASTPLDWAIQVANGAFSIHVENDEFLILDYLKAEQNHRFRNLALAMGTHDRLGRRDIGQASPLLHLPPEMIHRILQEVDLVNNVGNGNQDPIQE